MSHDKLPSMSRYLDTHIKLTKHRIAFISEDIGDEMAAELSALLLYFDSQSNAEISLYIHSNGGAATGLANIYDIMQMIKSPIKTVCMGKCYSAAAIILASGTKGRRFALKHSQVMIHGIQAVFPIPGHDMSNSKNYFEHLQTNNDMFMKILSNHTGLSLKKIKEDCKGDVWMDAKQALNYGVIDHIV